MIERTGETKIEEDVTYSSNIESSKEYKNLKKNLNSLWEEKKYQDGVKSILRVVENIILIDTKINKFFNNENFPSNVIKVNPRNYGRLEKILFEPYWSEITNLKNSINSICDSHGNLKKDVFEKFKNYVIDVYNQKTQYLKDSRRGT